MADKKIEIVASYTDTVPGKIIKLRAAMKFWNRYPGDTYSHISLSRDRKLGNMMSFARKEINNPFNSGLIKENIRTGMFALKPDVSRIAVMELKVSEQQYDKLSSLMDYYWENKDKYNFNFVGLTSMLIYGKGIDFPNSFFCSQWVATVLQDSNIDIFDGKKPKDIRPFDFYGTLKDSIIYEGLTTQYPEYNQESSYDDFPISDISSKQKIKDMNSSAIINRNAKLWR